MGRPSEYRLSEVRALVEGYAEWKELRSTTPSGGRLNLLLRLADLGRALRKLPPKEYQSVLLYGLMGLSSTAVGKALGVHHGTVLERYESGLHFITNYLNGADE